MSISLGDEVIRFLFISDTDLQESLDEINRERGRSNHAVALELCDEHLDRCVRRITAKGDLCRAAILMHRGAVYQDWGDPDQAYSDYLTASQLFAISNDEHSPWNEAAATYGRGLVAQSQKKWSTAQRFIKNAYGLFGSCADNSPIEHDVFAIILQRLRELKRMREIESLTDRSSNGIPIVGRASGGMPIVALLVSAESGSPDRLVVDHQSCRIKSFVDSSRTGPKNFWTSDSNFAVYIQGDSMKEAGIDDGDYAIFRRQAAPDMGDIVVVKIDDIGIAHSTVKRFSKRDGKVVLIAANTEFSPREQFFAESDPMIEVIGKVVAIATIV